MLILAVAQISVLDSELPPELSVSFRRLYFTSLLIVGECIKDALYEDGVNMRKENSKYMILISMQGAAGDKGEMGLPGDTGKPVNLI